MSFVLGLLVGLALAGAGWSLPKVLEWLESKFKKVEKDVSPTVPPAVTPEVTPVVTQEVK